MATTLRVAKKVRAPGLGFIKNLKFSIIRLRGFTPGLPSARIVILLGPPCGEKPWDLAPSIIHDQPFSGLQGTLNFKDENCGVFKMIDEKKASSFRGLRRRL